MREKIENPDLILHFSPSEVADILFNTAARQGRLDTLRPNMNEEGMGLKYQMHVQLHEGGGSEEDTLSLSIVRAKK